ncbi:MAG TPA: sigma-70 family RNA polymerase sigma factor [Dyella sp.]|uniref:RNA polymerase sigma factor n=1 Tax=Dyella sp. TaxID=1869338 RepID=UPI002F92050F
MDKPNQGDDAAAHRERIRALYLEHHRALVAFLHGRLSSAADAQEVAQEVYVKLLALEDVSHIESPKAFLFRMAANLSSDYQRKRGVRAAVPADPHTDDWHGTPIPEQHASALQQWTLVQEALRELPEKTRRAFVMHVIEGRDFSVVAQTMKLSERMVRYHVGAAMAHCRDRIAVEVPTW